MPVEIIGYPILGDQNEHLGAVIVFYDITERKRIEIKIHTNSAKK